MVKINTLLQAGCPKIRLQLTHKIETSELDEIPIVMREPLRRQPSVNRFADVYESLGLFTNIKHGGTPYEWKDKE
jgi:hypothetical protein